MMIGSPSMRLRHELGRDAAGSGEQYTKLANLLSDIGSGKATVVVDGDAALEVIRPRATARTTPGRFS